MDSEILRGVFGIVVLLAIAYRVFWDDSSEEFEQYTLPTRRPQQHRPVYHPPPHRLPPSQSYRSSPHRPPSPHGPPKYEDDSRKDQQNEYYIGLRARANKEGDEMARCFSERREAYSRRDRAAAMDLTNRGENHKQKMEQLNKEASNWIYLENNRDRKPGEIDLHGLYVKEAIAYTDAALKEAKLRGESEIRLIVGKGSHSEGGEAKLVAEFDTSNSGVLVIELDGLTPIRHRNISHRHSSGRHVISLPMKCNPYPPLTGEKPKNEPELRNESQLESTTYTSYDPWAGLSSPASDFPKLATTRWRRPTATGRKPRHVIILHRYISSSLLLSSSYFSWSKSVQKSSVIAVAVMRSVVLDVQNRVGRYSNSAKEDKTNSWETSRTRHPGLEDGTGWEEGRYSAGGGPASGMAGSTALTWQAMCCGHEGSYRCDRTVAYVSRSRDTSWGSFETRYNQTLEDTQDIEHYFAKEHKTSSLSPSISDGTTLNPEDVEEEKMMQKENRVD
ncbi:hypothetical protein EDD85DRAFT_798511 [Armillaria nabsnona]|nr:hypothetical protein EDD85DRAFT_798511 [Armillaria nabsnona]